MSRKTSLSAAASLSASSSRLFSRSSISSYSSTVKGRLTSARIAVEGEAVATRRSSRQYFLVGCALVAFLSAAVGERHVSFIGTAHAQDVLNSPACEGARSEFEAAMAQPAPTQASDQVRLKLQIERTRGIVAQRCFGRDADKPIPGRSAQAPIAVPPAVAAAGATRAPVPSVAAIPPAPSVDIPRPTVTTTCDAAGCWDSSGARLNQAVPGVSIGPRGACTTKAGVVNCN